MQHIRVRLHKGKNSRPVQHPGQQEREQTGKQTNGNRFDHQADPQAGSRTAQYLLRIDTFDAHRCQ